MSYIYFQDSIDFENEHFKEITCFYGDIKSWDADSCHLELNGCFDSHDLFERNDGAYVDAFEDRFCFASMPLIEKYLARCLDIPIKGPVGERTLEQYFDDVDTSFDAFTPPQKAVLVKAFELIQNHYSELLKSWRAIQECSYNLNEIDESAVDRLQRDYPEMKFTLSTSEPDYNYGWGIDLDENHWAEDCYITSIADGSYVAANVTLTVSADDTDFEWQSSGFISAKAEEFDALLLKLYQPLIDQANNYLSTQNAA